MNKDLISIIVPVYKVEKELSRCIESIQNQTYNNLEIILIDDGSPDNCPSICDEYAKTDTRIKVIHTENNGVSAARNTGIKEAIGEFIGFVDSDDYIETTMFEKLHEWITGNKSDAAICGWYVKKKVGTFLGVKNKCNIVIDMQESLFLAIRGGYFDGYLWNKLFRSSLLKSKKNELIFTMDTSLSVCEDLLFVCQVFTTCSKIVFNNIPLYNYVIRKESAVKTFNEKKLTEFIARQKIIDLVKPISRKLYNIAQFTYVQSTLSNYRELYIVGNKALAKRVRKLGHKYALQVFFPKNVSLKTRIRIIVMYIVPKLSVDFWLLLKKIFPSIQWEYGIEDKKNLLNKGLHNDS